jgi:hypothetical protein
MFEKLIFQSKTESKRKEQEGQVTLNAQDEPNVASGAGMDVRAW